MLPVSPRRFYVGACLFLRQQCFFYM
jgi:hypothetical protein